MRNITNKLYGRRVRPTRYRPIPRGLACNNQTSQAMAADNTRSNRLPSLKFVGDTLSFLALIDLDLLISNLVRVIALRVDNLSTNLGVSGTFCSRLRPMGQQLSDWPRDPATLTFNLGGHGACLWYGSSCTICPKIEVGRPSHSEDDTLLMSALIGLVTFELLTLKLLRFIVHGVCNLLINFGVSENFSFSTHGPTTVTHRANIAYHYLKVAHSIKTAASLLKEIHLWFLHWTIQFVTFFLSVGNKHYRCNFLVIHVDWIISRANYT